MSLLGRHPYSENMYKGVSINKRASLYNIDYEQTCVGCVANLVPYN